MAKTMRSFIFALCIITFCAACNVTPTPAPDYGVQIMPTSNPVFALTDSAATGAAAQRSIDIQTAEAQTTLDAAKFSAQLTAIAVDAKATVDAGVIQPTLTMAAATTTAAYQTQSAYATVISATINAGTTATAFPLTSTPQAAEQSAIIANARSNEQWTTTRDRFFTVLIWAGGLVWITICVMLIVVTVRSGRIIEDTVRDGRTIVRLIVEHKRAMNALALIGRVEGSEPPLYTLPSPDGSIEVRLIGDGSGPVVNPEFLQWEWRLAIWRFCEAAVAVGTFAGDAMEDAGVLLNDDANWKTITDYMVKAGILREKHEKSRTRYADDWNIERVRQERDTMPLPPTREHPPAVKFSLQRAD